MARGEAEGRVERRVSPIGSRRRLGVGVVIKGRGVAGDAH